ncbi:MAG: NAD(P)H-dependent glycerol-3-phosphate dehydrogenase [Gordonia sp. (in: high G+C Gram-positive bacteria)]|uniref:NAD(P)H-dependent glycerol-3-phosphate dehydrogenase n=1 Tax=Gordonia sp. (in: high G+C Gram-positive bacteria) TaxID=84139 RepID=UPI0039E4E789
MRAVVMGSGSWGTAVAKILVDAGNDVTMWARRPELAEQITTAHENSDYLAGIRLPDALKAVSSVPEALAGAELVVCAVPSQSLRANLEQWREHLPADAVLLSLAKGVEVTTGERMSQVIKEVTGFPEAQIAVLSGPNLAREIAEEQPAATVIACSDEEVATRIQAAFAAGYFRPYTNTDVVGTEIGGAAKNVIALACGMAAGLGFGENTLATLITRGLAETIRLGMALGADITTLAGLAGIGDLVATCSSPLSRNRTFGARLGEGKSLEEAQAATNGQVAEGVKSCRSVRALAHRYGVEMPLTEAVYQVCHEGMAVGDMVGMLLGRTTKPEVYGAVEADQTDPAR